MAEPAVRIEGLEKSYPLPGRSLGGLLGRRAERVDVLRGVDLEVAEGEIFGLLGPNGAGKSTLLRILATLVVADRGKAFVRGFDVRADEREVRSRIGVMLEHERSFFGRLSGRHNLRFFADLQGVPSSTAVERVDDLLGTVGLRAAADRRVQTYSLGMHHRLALARALLTDPELLLLDEPTRSLDPEARRDMAALLRGKLAGSGKTILLLTHDLELAASICDRVGFLVEGQVRSVGRPEQLIEAGRLDSLEDVYRSAVPKS